MEGILLLASVLLSALFVLAGITKLKDRAGFRQTLAEFGLPLSLASPISVFLPLAELGVGLALIPVATAWWGAMGALALLLVFTVGIGINLAQSWPIGSKQHWQSSISIHEGRIMKTELKHRRNILAVLGIILGLAIASSPRAFADGQQGEIFPPDENIIGMTYGDWSAAWWQYVLSIPAGTNPVLDTTGTNCGIEQSASPVFFLTGAATTDPVIRTCTVPAEKVLFFPIINTECSTVEAPPFFGSNAQELRNCAARLINGVGVGSLTVLIDGKPVHNLRRFRVQSPLFDFIMPQDNFLGLPGVTSGSAVSDGYWLMLESLPPGEHEIHFEGAFVSGAGAGFSQNVTYNLTVRR